MRKTMITVASALSALALTATAAFGYAEGDTLFVGKGEVQTALAYNNTQLQNNAPYAFSYSVTETYEVTCTWEAGNSGKIQTRVRSREVSSAVEVTGESRKNPQGSINGFHLTFGAEDSTGDVPEIGGTCQAEGNNGKITRVELLSSEDGGLMVTSSTGAKASLS